MVDNMFMKELLPYLLRLEDSEDVREVISFDCFGQPPIPYEHEFNFWNDQNLKWSMETINTDRLPLVEKLQTLCNKQETTNPKNSFKIRRDQIIEIFAKEQIGIDSMKAPQMISLARKLGCTTRQLKLTSAKAFIKNLVLNEHNLLTLDRKQ